VYTKEVRTMKAVGIKTLKAKLGEYVRLAKAGETILVTERENVVAELRPAHRQRLGVSTLHDELEALAERHEVTLRSAEGPWPGPRAVAHDKSISSAAILDSLRAEG
jgi:antitoxin (DNA-binding transcriptional repressor) of toxin-antitoxin stability system